MSVFHQRHVLDLDPEAPVSPGQEEVHPRTPVSVADLGRQGVEGGQVRHQAVGHRFDHQPVGLGVAGDLPEGDPHRKEQLTAGDRPQGESAPPPPPASRSLLSTARLFFGRRVEVTRSC